jgi:hypothetical protein
VPFRLLGSFFWAAPLFSKSLRNNFYGVVYHFEVQAYEALKQGAQPRRKDELNGKAQPFLTSGGEAVSKTMFSCRARVDLLRPNYTQSVIKKRPRLLQDEAAL